MGFGLDLQVTSTLRDTIATCVTNISLSSPVIDVLNVLVIYFLERVNNHFSCIIPEIFLLLTRHHLDIVKHFPHISSHSHFFANWLVQSFMTFRRVKMMAQTQSEVCHLCVTHHRRHAGLSFITFKSSDCSSTFFLYGECRHQICMYWGITNKRLREARFGSIIGWIQAVEWIF